MCIIVFLFFFKEQPKTRNNPDVEQEENKLWYTYAMNYYL